eukprot:CAMPEP_0184489746 /NCGR_PEP_ID=MMETSP0113_2-20130426/16268_1 /TAXON_ID=91329 /ORGANISM="Norrisiella sphaerica, Strain BC52" /LENGTH=291 /DNA_ID=CAMNT_0026873341 /DNA_START=1 /DNA_END=872 /DNA_ORIENTATION=-
MAYCLYVLFVRTRDWEILFDIYIEGFEDIHFHAVPFFIFGIHDTIHKLNAIVVHEVSLAGQDEANWDKIRNFVLSGADHLTIRSFEWARAPIANARVIPNDVLQRERRQRNQIGSSIPELRRQQYVVVRQRRPYIPPQGGPRVLPMSRVNVVVDNDTTSPAFTRYNIERRRPPQVPEAKSDSKANEWPMEVIIRPPHRTKSGTEPQPGPGIERSEQAASAANTHGMSQQRISRNNLSPPRVGKSRKESRFKGYATPELKEGEKKAIETNPRTQRRDAPSRLNSSAIPVTAV